MATASRQAKLRELIQGFLTERLNGKLEALKPDDPKRTELQTQFSWRTWLDDAARRSAQIQCATHTLKPIHPDARGSSLYVGPQDLPVLDEVGSHCLGDSYADDVVGNAAALDVFKFLKLAQNGRTLLQLACAQDADLAEVLSTDPVEARRWMADFAALVQPRGTPATHGYAKQLYWRVDEDPHADASYHLIAPLFGSALAHSVWQTLQEHRFGDAAKAARQARKEGADSDTPVYEYPHLAVRKMGGTKPQNISQLNSERGGNNPLLASLPPLWQTREQLPHTNRRLMARFGYRPEVKQTLQQLRQFLESNPSANQGTRQRRDAMVFDLLDEWLQLSATLRTVTPGWSQRPECQLSAAQKHWLDPEGVVQAALDASTQAPEVDETLDTVAEDLARWINGQLRDPLPLGDREFTYWRSLVRDELAQEAWALQEAADVC
ncbi:type I-F CRISPR-associated protein Csy1 [Pantoea sp. 18069]|uniref:type I-F CRISPR-associated protein Csy1 n=1 Tax=Pantoea sp. 18069 TaxID=2681415 RepID=UPI001357571A|nr:type I-F CRISPR-associated protein Csy1 [Pantoea sp. 18069]